MDLLDQLGALDPALEQRVDEDDVRAELADLARPPCEPSVRTSSSLTCGLRVQQAADVLGDLRNVLDDEQARLVSR